jgi:hypothetical protein
VDPCALECSAGGQCPPGLACAADGFCHETATEARCDRPSIDASSTDAAIDAQTDATVDPGPRPPNTAGELIVSEVMKNPCASQGGGLCLVPDTSGEWFEVHNPTATILELEGLVIRDDDGETFSITAPIDVPPGGHVVIGNNANPQLNGGVQVDFTFAPDLSGMILFNDGVDAIEIVLPGPPLVVLDRVVWDDGSYPDVTGAALSLDAASLDATANDLPASWCAAVSMFGDGDRGTPRALNPTCP